MNVSASLVEMEAPVLMSSTHSAASVPLESQVFFTLLAMTVFGHTTLLQLLRDEWWVEGNMGMVRLTLQNM